MGMDVHGVMPLSKTGEYFRNSVWWWRPLAEYVLEVAPSVASRCSGWQYNDGDGLNAEDSRELAGILSEEVDSGRCAAYSIQRDKGLIDLPLKACWLCNGTGTRPGGLGQFGREWVQATNGCNGCQGTGTKPDDRTYYRFSVENIAEFAAFLRDCGGFTID